MQADKVPEWLAYSFLKVKDSIPYNCAWGFLTEEDLRSDDFKAISSDFSANRNKMVKADKVANGTVIEFPTSVMYQVFTTVMPEVPRSFVENYTSKREEVYKADCMACKKFLEGIIAKGKSAELDFGLYCVNKTNAIKHGDVVYKAYKMNFETFFKLAAKLGIQNNLYIKNIETGTVVPITSTQAQNPHGVGNFIIADSGNGVVCKLIYRK
jgi:hypothetical protein